MARYWYGIRSGVAISMVFCRSRQLREKTMTSYEQTLRLFQRWCEEQMKISTVDIFKFVAKWERFHVFFHGVIIVFFNLLFC